MEFRLIYEGEIRPRRQSSLSDIHRIRDQLRPQIAELFNHHPLNEAVDLFRERSEEHSYATGERTGGLLFTPLISRHIGIVAELDIIFLRQQPPGRLISDGGDIDNRVKTLLDALRMPGSDQVSQLDIKADENEQFHVLLQDDALVTRLNVETDRLLRTTDNPHDMVAIIGVKTRLALVSLDNLFFLA